MKVLVVCAAGMSSSLLVRNLRLIAQERGDTEVKIGSCASNQIEKYMAEAELILLSPGLMYLYQELKEKNNQVIVKIIPAHFYGMKSKEDSQEVYHLISNQQARNTSLLEKSRLGILIIRLSYHLGSNAVIQSINDGMMAVLPITLIGSVLVLLRSFIMNAGIDKGLFLFLSNLFQIGIDGTSNLISVYVTYFITYSYAKRRNTEPITATVNALICFFLLVGRGQDSLYVSASFLGFEGLFTAMIVAILATIIFDKVKKHVLRKKDMLKAISSRIILESLYSVIPLFVSISVSLAFASIFYFTPYHVFPGWVYASIHQSIASIAGNNIISDSILTFLTNALWFVGIHGGNLIGSITKPIYSSFAYENLAALNSGNPLPHIIHQQFRYMYIFGGAGSSFGLVLLMSFFAKSERMKRVGRVSFPLSFFFINETVLFGLPIVLNLMMLLPFLFITPSLGLLTYFAMKAQLIPIAVGFDIPWNTPMLISGFIQGGIQLALWQCLMIFLSMLLWYPFFRMQDKLYYKQEKQSLHNHARK